MFAQSDILGYNPAPGDLAYPERFVYEMTNSLSNPFSSRLVMMNSINSANQSPPHQDNNGTIAEDGSSKPLPNKSSAAIDLHCLWYPTVRRTVMCLSKLYKCLDVGSYIRYLSKINVDEMFIFSRRCL